MLKTLGLSELLMTLLFLLTLGFQKFNMKAQFLSLLVISAFSLQSQSTFTASLINKLEVCQLDEALPVLVLLEDQLDFQKLKYNFKTNGVNMASRAENVYHALHEQKNQSQTHLISILKNENLAIGEIKSFWINNSLAFICAKENIEIIKGLPGIKRNSKLSVRQIAHEEHILLDQRQVITQAAPHAFGLFRGREPLGEQAGHRVSGREPQRKKGQCDSRHGG